MNCLRIMDESMLAREIKPGSNVGSYKYFMVTVVVLKHVIQLFKAPYVMYIASGDVTEFQEHMQCLHHIIGDISFNCW